MFSILISNTILLENLKTNIIPLLERKFKIRIECIYLIVNNIEINTLSIMTNYNIQLITTILSEVKVITEIYCV